jgi:hypothetical protein
MSDECRAYAADCLRVADKVTDVKTKATLLDMVDFQAHCSAISPTKWRFF